MATGVIRALQMQKPSTPRYRSALPLGSAKKRGVGRAALRLHTVTYDISPAGNWLSLLDCKLGMRLAILLKVSLKPL